MNMYRVKLTPVHGSKGIKPLLCTVGDKKLKLLLLTESKSLIKTKLLESIFAKTGRHTKEVGTELLNAWIQSVKDAHDGKLTLNNAGLKKGTYFKFKGENVVRVYENKGWSPFRHTHYKFDDAGGDSTTCKGDREIETDFTF